MASPSAPDDETDMTQLTIRRAMPADAPALRRLQHASMRELAIAYYDADVIEAFIDHVGTMDERLIGDGTYFVAAVRDTLVGCGGFSSRLPNYSIAAAGESVHAIPGAATVRSIFVHPAFARQGVARRIMTHIEGEIIQAGHAMAALAATLSGVPFYRRLGYRSGAPMVLRLPGELLFVGIKMTKSLGGSGMRAAA